MVAGENTGSVRAVLGDSDYSLLLGLSPQVKVPRGGWRHVQ